MQMELEQDQVANHKQSDGLGLASLIVSIVGLCVPFISIVGLVLGIISMTKVGANAKNLIGTILGGLWLLLLPAILLPALGRARISALTAADSAVLSTLAMASNDGVIRDYLFVEREGIMSGHDYLGPGIDGISLSEYDRMSDEQKEAWITENTHFIICFGWPGFEDAALSKTKAENVVLGFAKKREKGLGFIPVLYADFHVARLQLEDISQIEASTGYSYEQWTSGKKLKRKLDMHFTAEQIEQFKADGKY